LSYRLTKSDISKITTEDLGGMPWRIARCEITPRDKPHTEFESGAQTINHLLRHPEIHAIMHRPASTAERDAVVLPAHPQTGLLPLKKPADLEGDRYQGPGCR
jgi:hypothetical protein